MSTNVRKGSRRNYILFYARAIVYTHTHTCVKDKNIISKKKKIYQFPSVYTEYIYRFHLTSIKFKSANKLINQPRIRSKFKFSFISKKKIYPLFLAFYRNHKYRKKKKKWSSYYLRISGYDNTYFNNIINTCLFSIHSVYNITRFIRKLLQQYCLWIDKKKKKKIVAAFLHRILLWMITCTKKAKYVHIARFYNNNNNNREIYQFSTGSPFQIPCSNEHF